MNTVRLQMRHGVRRRGASVVLIAGAALVLCLLPQMALAAPAATLQGTDDHDTRWRVTQLSERLGLLERQAEAGQDELFLSNCRHMDDSLFTIASRLRQIEGGDRVRVFISYSPVARTRAELERKKDEKSALIATGIQYNNAIDEIGNQLNAGVRTFHINWLKALFRQLKPAVSLPKAYEIPTEFWNWYNESEEAGRVLTDNMKTINNLSQLREVLRERQREVLDAAQELTQEIEAEEPRVARLENAFDSVIAKHPFVVVGDAPPMQAQQQPEVSICFLVDVSGSMSGRKLAEAKDAVRASIAGTNDGRTEWALLSFGGCRVHEVQGFTQSAEQIMAAVDGLSARGDTPMTYAMYKAATYVAREGQGTRSRRMIVLCDGQDNCRERGSVTREEAMDGLRTIIREIPVPMTGGIRP